MATVSTQTERDDALSILRTAVGDESATFRSGQWEAIDAVVNHGGHLLVVERTGWGKSSVYFISTRILRNRGLGPTLIVSPLLALMRNQVEAAARLGIRALTMNSTNKKDWPSYHADIAANQIDALIISPEHMANDEFVEKVLLPNAANIGLLVVDEAHCISDWGHDFRPDYRRLVNVLKKMPPTVSVLGTTATANDRVVEDVKTQLGDIAIQRGSLMRETLSLQTVRLPSQEARLAWLAEHVPTIPGTGIIYALTKRDVYQVTEWLVKNGIDAKPYYSGITSDQFPETNDYRQYLESLLLGNDVKVLVATTALGMGYDKPDLGFVIHYQSPGSVITYYQQVGRAGRAIDQAYGVLLSGKEDDEIHTYFRGGAFPKEEWIDTILERLAHSDGLSEMRIEDSVNLRRGQIKQVLKTLSVENPSPVLNDKGVWRRTPVPFKMDDERIDRLTSQRESEWKQMQRYIDTKGCLMQFLAVELDDPQPQPCGKCANCLDAPPVPVTFSNEKAIEAAQFLKHTDLEIECNKQIPFNAFPIYQIKGRIPENFRAEKGRSLSRWNDAGWGRMVADDKHAGKFRQDLVDAVVDMILNRWNPQPSPNWITCIPSAGHPDLVPDFCKRLSTALSIPFIPAIEKCKSSSPQKMQNNGYHQAHNLDGVFKLTNINHGSVLLVDDVVDSGWTLTVASVLLKKAGVSHVFPLVLTTSGVGV